MLFDDWLVQEKKNEEKHKRRYLHFDPYINVIKNAVALRKYLTDQVKIGSHEFYPLIHSDINTLRYKKTKELNERNKNRRKMEIKSREIYYAAHLDSLVYSWYSYILTTSYVALAKSARIYDCVTAYLAKNKKNNIHYANEVFDHIKNQNSCVVIALDIKSFFDGLDHEQLKSIWTRVIGGDKLPRPHLKIYNSVTRFSYVDREDLKDVFPQTFFSKEKKVRICTPKEFREFVRGGKFIKENHFVNKVPMSPNFGKMCGIPQGTPISACLANIYMIDFDCKLKNWIDGVNGFYRRYSDDIILVVPTNKIEQAKDYVKLVLWENQLLLNEEKTEVTFFFPDQNGCLSGYKEADTSSQRSRMQYLGFEFDGKKIHIRSSSYSKYYKSLTLNIRRRAKSAKGKKSKNKIVYKKSIYRRFTNKGEQNFMSYTKRAAEIMDSDSIREQSKPNMKKVKKAISRVSEKYGLESGEINRE